MTARSYLIQSCTSEKTTNEPQETINMPDTATIQESPHTLLNGATAPVVEVSGLRKTYPRGVEAVKGIDFSVAVGEVFGLLGPNGAGKSTTIGMLTTTIAPTAGSAQLAGFDVAKQPLLARSVSSVVFQDAVVDGSLSGRENLDLHARLWGVHPTRAK